VLKIADKSSLYFFHNGQNVQQSFIVCSSHIKCIAFIFHYNDIFMSAVVAAEEAKKIITYRLL
jgi:hypothetical protein